MRDSQAISVRQMCAEDEGAVRALAGRAFPPLGSVLFSPSPHVLVAMRNERLVGAVVLKMFALPGKSRVGDRRGGVMLWLMTDPETRGFGVGGHLVEAALGFFEEWGCKEVFACVEGFNTSSSRLFAARGFEILPPGEQIRRYGLLGTFVLWSRTYRLGGDVGHFLWARPGATKPDNPPLQWWVGAFVGVLIFLLAGWRGGWIEVLDPAMILGGIAAVMGLYGLREAAMRLAARFQGLSVRHRAWESAFPLSIGIALAFGIFVPTPGSVYPQGNTWRYRDIIPKLGSTAFAGVVAVLIFAWGTWVLLRFGGPTPEVTAGLHAARIAGLMLVLFDVLLPFSLFVSFDGRRVWDWNRPAWGALAIAVAGLFLVGE